LKEIGPLASSLEVLIFDDASSDRTGPIAEALAAEDPRVRVFHNQRRLNIGGIYKAGIRHAKGEYLFLVPGDNEIRIDEVARGLRNVGAADIIVFYVRNVGVRPRSRRVLSRLYVGIVNLVFNTRFRYTNSTNVFRTDILRGLSIRTDGFSYQTEALVKAVWAGADFLHVGIELRPRAFGRSKALSWKNVTSVLCALAQLWWDLNVRERRRYCRRGRELGVA
jgi:dolichol-phosphate mannosyltransferase